MESSEEQLLAANKDIVDDRIEVIARMKMKDVVIIKEGKYPRIDCRQYDTRLVSLFLSQLFTDAVFHDDIRAIKMIINRIDGGLPKDTQVSDYRTLFGDCLLEIMEMDDVTRLKPQPEESVMLNLCKALFIIATEDLHDIYIIKRGHKIIPKEAKADQEAARKLILDRIGGRKTTILQDKAEEEVELAGWIQAALPEPK